VRFRVGNIALCIACWWSAELYARILDHFENPALWQVQHTDDVTVSLHGVDEKAGKALRLDFDFTDAHGNPINGYATAQRALPIDLPDNYEISFWIRADARSPSAMGRSASAPEATDGREGPIGRSPSAAEAKDGQERPPVNTLQFKLIDASGENVWWLSKTDFAFPRAWQRVAIQKRQIEFAWGPTKDRELRHAASIEFVVSSGRDGGKGSVYFDQLELHELPPPDTSPLRPRLHASSALADFPPSAAMDGDAQTAWRSDPAKGLAQYLDVDFGRPREIGGLILHWRNGERATDWNVQESIDGKRWRSCAGLHASSGDDDALALCGRPARYIRLVLSAGAGRSYGLSEIEFKNPAWSATPNAFFRNVVRTAARGTYPRGFVEQPYWTIVGIDGGPAPALISEDGAIEPRKGGYSIEPFLLVDGRRITWADVTSTPSLLAGYLPLPRVEWKSDPLILDIDAFARGTREAAQLVARYRVRNTTDAPVDATLQLAVRPFQVNPPAQFLNSPGGVTSIQNLRWDGVALHVNDDAVWPLTVPDAFERLNLDASPSRNQPPAPDARSKSIHDDFGEASGAFVYKLHLSAHAEREIDLIASMYGSPAAAAWNYQGAAEWVEHEQKTVADAWRAKLDQVTLQVPPQAQRIADTLRTAHAHLLMSRDGPALRPGTRSYARSWIRDGAMIADALLRLGDITVVRDYVDWYAPHQFANGKVPCCVDHRGSDPVPENDSHGELIHAIAQLYRYTADRGELEKNWAHVQAAIGYMDGLRASESGTANPAFKGLLPASISHEGYSAKPMHSYWDDFWALTGYNDAAALAQVLGNADLAAKSAARDAFRHDLLVSLDAATKAHAIDYLPGSAELGDFDATSTTVALEPAGAQAALPQDLLHNTFERYWHGFVARRDGDKLWEDYTPYEWRVVGTFVRLGWRDRAQALIDFFFITGARPPAWNQWAEVVGRDARAPRFIGDMPHAWVASDFIRSALDLFAYEREDQQVLVLAAGIPASWLTGAEVGIANLRTPYGKLTYTLRQSGNTIVLHLAAGVQPPGGFVLPWPLPGAAGTTTIDGKRAAWRNGELHLDTAPAEIVIDTARQR
jgi:hypothetical protein